VIPSDQYTIAQASVLGSMVIDDRCAPRVLHRTREEDYIAAYRTVFRSASGLFASGKPIDPTTLLSALGQDYSPFLRELMELTPTAANVDAYIDILLEESKRNRLMECGELLAQRPALEDGEAIVQRINRILGDRPGVRVVTMAEGVEGFFARQKTQPKFLPWGLDKLGRTLMVEQGGDFIVLGGYPSAGKTALSVQMAWEQAKTLRVGYFSLETRPEKLIDRAVAMATGIDFGRIKRHQMDAEDWGAFSASAIPLSDRSLDVIQAGGMTATEIQAISLSGKYDVIYIDYLQLIRGESPRMPEFERVTAISLALHTMAQTAGITVIALSQLVRPDRSAGEEKAPTLHSLRQSGQIEQDADAVLLLYKTSPDPSESERTLKIAKNKEGESGGLLALDFDGATQRFSQVESAPSASDVAGRLSRAGRAVKRANQAKQTDMFSDLAPDTELPPEFKEGSQ